jgi:hypothetical protein
MLRAWVKLRLTCGVREALRRILVEGTKPH